MLGGGEACSWNEARAWSDGRDGSKEIENVQSRNGGSVELGGWARVWADGPIIHVEKGLEELLGEESSIIGLMEVDALS